MDDCVKVRLIIPQDTPPTGGNRISAARLAGALGARGVTVTVDEGLAQLGEADIYHAFNAAKVGMGLVERGVEPERIVVTWTGTDLWQDFVAQPERLRRALAHVAFHAVFTEDARARLLQDAPEWASVIRVIPPAVHTELFSPGPAERTVPHPMVLLAGGIRPVKRSAWAVTLVEQLREVSGLPVTLVVAGPIRDLAEGQRLFEAARDRSWVWLLGEVPAAEMPSWYRAADLVLNTSLVEGVSNALMEAMSTGAVVIATDIAGNRYLIEDGVNGLLYHTEAEFVAKAAALLQGQLDGRRLGEQARARILRRHSLVAEADAYLELYQLSLHAVRRCCR